MVQRVRDLLNALPEAKAVLGVQHVSNPMKLLVPLFGITQVVLFLKNKSSPLTNFLFDYILLL
jgi:hypothetical protein